jgi:hypothetical protein
MAIDNIFMKKPPVHGKVKTHLRKLEKPDFSYRDTIQDVSIPRGVFP